MDEILIWQCYVPELGRLASPPHQTSHTFSGQETEQHDDGRGWNPVFHLGGSPVVSILTRVWLDLGGIKAECEGRVHTPALTEQCPVAWPGAAGAYLACFVLYALHNSWKKYILLLEPAR